MSNCIVSTNEGAFIILGRKLSIFFGIIFSFICMLQSYMDHIRGRTHRILRAAYQDNIDAQISLLRANSQVSS